MQASEKNKVSLRGASVKEITRDALLEKTAKERAERSHARKVLHAASLIQCVWRGRSAACEAAESFRVEWDRFVAGGQYMDYQTLSVDRLCKCIIRPFLFFAGHHRSCLHRDRKNIGADDERFVTCFKILLQSINCPDPAYNFCTLCIGSKEQKITWSFQVHELLNLCCIALIESSAGTEGVTSLATLSIRLMVALTDANLWKSISHVKNDAEAVRALQGILEWIVDRNTGFYPALRIFILQFCPFPSFNVKQDTSKEKFVTIASAVTLALRPLQCFSNNVKSAGISVDYICGNYSFLARKSAEHFCKEILTIPFLTNRLPSAILPALRHASAFVPSLQAFVTSANHIFQGASVSISFSSKPTYPLTPHVLIPLCACALANVVTLASASSVKCPRNGVFPGQFVDGLDYPLYVKAVCALLDCMTPWADSLKNLKKGILQDVREEEFSITDNEKAHDLQNNIMLVVEALGPLHQRWHLEQLLDRTFISFHSQHAMHANVEPELMACISLPDVARLYASLMNAFSSLNPLSGALPILNVLAFTQDLLLKLWNWLDGALSLGGSSSAHIFKESRMCASENLQESKVMQDGTFGQNLSRKWSSAVSKLKGKHFSSQSIDGGICKISLEECTSQEQELTTGSWNVVNLRKGAAGISDEAVSVFLLFCALYAHLLLVLDDEEFYERQVPFSLEQQRTISASLNTMLYNEFFSSSRHCFSSLLEAGTRCLHSLYMRDCRRPFCPPSLWLAPAVSNRPPVAAAARAHEVAVASIRTGELSQAPAMGYVLTTFPHVWPFEERVQIFREFVTSDKICRKMAGESIGPGPGSIEIAIRRGHIVEDGFAQLNHLGAKLKTGLNVSFVNEHGLQEAGLDYGGLFKEFLTDLAKAAFDPGYGLFTQTATEERLLFPHPASASLGHGLQMFEFLGRIVGKALYEGILLDYSFSHVFIWALLGRYSFLDELSTLDPELHRNLMYLKYYEGDARELALDFTVTEEIFGKRIVVELRAGGQKISVTNENKLQYIHAIADYKLNRQLKPLVNAFAKGFSDLIEPDWLGLFNAREFNQLLSGGEHDFDVNDLKSNTQYTGGYTESSRIIKFFWQVLREFKPQERCALLKFVTSCSRAPLLGFKYLQPAFTIHKVACNTPVWSMLGGEDVQRLPSASTCYNTLKLPTYKRVATLRSKLQYAIHSNAGFELS